MAVELRLWVKAGGDPSSPPITAGAPWSGRAQAGQGASRPDRPHPRRARRDLARHRQVHLPDRRHRGVSEVSSVASADPLVRAAACKEQVGPAAPARVVRGGTSPGTARSVYLNAGIAVCCEVSSVASADPLVRAAA